MNCMNSLELIQFNYKSSPLLRELYELSGAHTIISFPHTAKIYLPGYLIYGFT